MSKVSSWSTTPGSNNAATPDGWPEGQLPSSVNDCAREMMAAIRTVFNDLQYVDPNFTPTYISATTFSVAGNQTSAIHANRRLKIFDATATVATVIYATVVTASFTTVTTIQISADAGQLTSSLTSFAIAILSRDNNSLPRALSLDTATGLPLTTGVTGVLPVANGGTGTASFVDAGVLIGNGTGAFQVTTAGSAGEVLTSNGPGIDPSFKVAIGAGFVSLTAPKSVSADEVSILAFSAGANTLMVGTSFTFNAFYTRSGSATIVGIIRLRAGPTSLAGNIAGVVSVDQTPTSSRSFLQGLATVVSTGAAGLIQANIALFDDGLPLRVGTSSLVAIDTTVANLIEITHTMQAAGVIPTTYNLAHLLKT